MGEERASLKDEEEAVRRARGRTRLSERVSEGGRGQSTSAPLSSPRQEPTAPQLALGETKADVHDSERTIRLRLVAVLAGPRSAIDGVRPRLSVAGRLAAGGAAARETLSSSASSSSEARMGMSASSYDGPLLLVALWKPPAAEADDEEEDPSEGGGMFSFPRRGRPPPPLEGLPFELPLLLLLGLHPAVTCWHPSDDDDDEVEASSGTSVVRRAADWRRVVGRGGRRATTGGGEGGARAVVGVGGEAGRVGSSS